MSSAEQSLKLLQTIADGINKLVILMERNPSVTGATVAPDKDLDSPYGDEEVKFNPKDWSGPSMKGRKMSQCPPEFLDMLAESFEYFATKADANKDVTSTGKPMSGFKRKSASRARGWALRMRNGTRPMPAVPKDAEDWGDDSPRW